MKQPADSEIIYRCIKPDDALRGFVESFWMLHNPSELDKEVVILPDGNIDLFCTESSSEPFHITLLGIGTKPVQAVLKAHRITFAISFRPLGAEYLLWEPLADMPDRARNLQAGFWGFVREDLADFEVFVSKSVRKIESLLPRDTDPRKQKLFEQIFASNGELSVAELAEKVCWSSRQINRYFNRQLGLSLKAYSNVVRFRASFEQIKAGKLYPEQNFSDQSHFIRTVKKLAGVNPKKLMLNQNDRFIQFSTLTDT